MGFPPQLFIIGAQKSGTTALATMLGQHPQICLAEPKEPHYFTRDYQRGPDWYRQQFSDPNADWLLDASTSYSHVPSGQGVSAHEFDPRYSGVPQRIAELCGTTPKFFYIMRDPVYRTYAGYWHAVRAGHEKRPFDEAISNGPYLAPSDYAVQLQAFFEVFPKQNVMPLLFEEYVQDPQAWAGQCFRFIGIDDTVQPNQNQGRNSSFVFRGVLGTLNRQMGQRGGLSPLFSALSRITPRPVKRLATRALTKPVPAMSVAQREQLSAHFRPQIQQLEHLLERSIDCWPK